MELKVLLAYIHAGLPHLGIHSMELKGKRYVSEAWRGWYYESIQWNWKAHYIYTVTKPNILLNPFNGIERLIFLRANLLRTAREESIQWNWKGRNLVQRYKRVDTLRNPFNGIESGWHSVVLGVLRRVLNPFNGIESPSLRDWSPHGSPRGIHSMELKVLSLFSFQELLDR